MLGAFCRLTATCTLFFCSISREMPLAELKEKYRKVSSLEKARSGWEEEYEVSSKQVIDAW